MVMLQNVCKNCVRILEEEKHRQLRMRMLSIREAPSTSIHRRSQQLNISETSLRRILDKDLYMKPYKVQLFQELKPIDHPMRSRFAKWACDLLTEDADFAKKNHIFR